MDTNEWMTVKTCARLRGCSVSAIHGLCNRATLKAKWTGGMRVILRSDFEAWLADDAAQKRSRLPQLKRANVAGDGVDKASTSGSRAVGR